MVIVVGFCWVPYFWTDPKQNPLKMVFVFFMVLQYPIIYASVNEYLRHTQFFAMSNTWPWEPGHGFPTYE